MPTTKSLTIEPVGDRDLRFTREFDAPPALVFEAFTTPALLKQWMLGPDGWTLPVCEIDLRPGGRFRYVWRKGEREMAMSGQFLEIAAPTRIVHTELFEEDWTGGETVVTTTLSERGGRTAMELAVRYASSDARDGAMAGGMSEGMAQAYDTLEARLADGTIGGRR
jgi:uncharacterized protein YndB with AHSA1/START domain